MSKILQDNFLKRFDDIVNNSDELSLPEIQRELTKEFRNLIEVEDPFLEEKKESNIQALKIYKRWEPIIFKEPNPFKTTLRLAIAGNIMDYGAADYFDIDSVIIKVLHADFAIDHSCLLKEKIEDAKNILYLGDNAGEIVFDRLFIKSNMSDKLTYVVKGGPVLNDVTLRDADEVEMRLNADVITNGYDAP
ncbi:MAG: ARMT1-like domain-containing protein, partial [Bacteroidales bacterium]|nr:ARMT1-like domain-containing protein [Bacteroidales bacterium]